MCNMAENLHKLQIFLFPWPLLALVQSGSLAHSLVGSWNKLVFSRWITQELSVHTNVTPESVSVGTSIYLQAISWCDTSDFKAGGSISALLQCGNQETTAHSCCLPLGEFLGLPCSYSPLRQPQSICLEGKPWADLCVRSCETSVFPGAGVENSSPGHWETSLSGCSPPLAADTGMFSCQTIKNVIL